MKKIFKLIQKHNLTISSCESFTGGMFANEFTNIKNSSKYFKGGFICYSDEFKQNILNIDIQVIKKYNVVSKEVLDLMLLNTFNILKTDLVVGFTGYATPLDKQNHLSGVSYIGFRINNNNYIYKFEIKTNILRKKYKKKAIAYLQKQILKEI